MVRETRESEMREEIYNPPGDLTLPEGMEDRYRQNGYHLRWVRAELNGQDDSRNLAARQREGYSWVSKNELQEEWKDFFDTRKIRTNNQVVCVGDLVLAKIELRRAKARQKYFEDQSSAQVTRAKNTARDGNGEGKTNKHLDSIVPLTDESKTEVDLGKKSSDD